MGILATVALAQTSQPPQASPPSSAAVVLFVVPIVSILATGIVAWVFWRAKRREDSARKELEDRKRKELAWRNARLS